MVATMQYAPSYKNLIWTNHVITRLEERKIPQELAWRAFAYPDTITDGRNGSIRFQKKHEGITITLVAKKNEKKEWILLSCWVDPPLPGSTDIQKRKDYWAYRKQPFIVKLIRGLFSLFFPK